MAGAVANPQYMGYKALYKTVLEDSKRGIAKAMRVYADPEAFPVLIHCIDGQHASLVQWTAALTCVASALPHMFSNYLQGDAAWGLDGRIAFLRA